MSEQEEELRAFAAQCESMAANCADEQEKIGWLSLAEYWLRKLRAIRSGTFSDPNESAASSEHQAAKN